MKTDDEKAFDSAVLYACNPDEDRISADTWGEALGEHVEQGGVCAADMTEGVTIYAYERLQMNPLLVEQYSHNAAEVFFEQLEEKYGDYENPCEKVPQRLNDLFLEAARQFLQDYTVYRCEVVARRELTLAELREWVKKEMPEWEEDK